METSDSSSIDVENVYKELATSIERELTDLGPISREPCIFRVPDRMRRLNERAFTPQVVSIGPLHHGKESLQAMEEHKKKCLQDFLNHSTFSLGNYIRVIKDEEAQLRSFYAATVRRIASDDFVRTVLVDAAFVIEVFLSEAQRKRVDGSLIDYIVNDMFLLENQLPFFIIEKLYLLAYGHVQRRPLIDVSLKFANSFFARHIHLNVHFFSARHMVDLLAICLRPSSQPENRRIENFKLPSATALRRAGITIRSAASNNLFDIKFEKGILEIPLLRVGDNTELIPRNVLAFQRGSSCEFGIADYVVFMGYLMSSWKDADLLIQNRIVDNLLRDANDLSTLFKGLTQEVFIDPANFYFSGVVEDLNGYCRSPWHNWCATLRQEYFKNPWATSSVIAAVVLLVLTFVQTVCSLIQVI